MKYLLALVLAFLLLILPSCTPEEASYSIITDQDGDITDVSESSALSTILSAHHEIHKGNYYYIKDFTTVNTSESVDFLFIVANTTVPHVQWQLASEAEYRFYLYEDVDVSDNGTSVTTFNANRNSSNTATMLVFSSPTLAGGTLGDEGQGGTLISASTIGSNRETTANRITTYELIGKRNTKYWVRMTNVSAGSAWVDYDFNWYEEDIE